MVNATPVLVLTDKEKFSQFYQAIKEETDALDADVSTEKGRKAIASMAYKVARTKTAIDDAGKKLNEEARAKISAVDEARREIRQQLDALKDQVRAPLTEWEEAEEKRAAEAAQELASIHAMQRVDIGDTVASVEERLNALTAMTVKPSVHAAGFEIASNARAAAIEMLETALARLRREEQERAELERLRAEKAEAEERERAVEGKRKYARDVIEHIRQCGLGMIGGKAYPYIILIRELEEKVVATEADFGDMTGDVEAARVETLARIKEAQTKQEERKAREAAEAAAEEARQDEARKATETAAERERAHAEALAAERKRAEEAEAAAQAERERVAREEAQRKAEAERVAAEQKAREADRAHRSKIMTGAKEAIMEAGSIDEQAAKNIVLAIVGGSVPNISLRF